MLALLLTLSEPTVPLQSPADLCEEVRVSLQEGVRIGTLAPNQAYSIYYRCLNRYRRNP